MAKAVLCPVCLGKGKLAKPDWTLADALAVCHGCHGKGWVEVGD